MNLIANKGDFVLEGATATSIDAVGFSLRRRGVQIRDCIAVQSIEGPSFILVGQVPVDQTFVEQVVRGSGSVLDIDSSRVFLDLNDPYMRPNAKNHNYSGERKKRHNFKLDSLTTADMGYHNSKGRFPANLILKHGLSCVCEGGGEGTERICEPSCPVGILDRQSGELHSQDPATRNNDSRLDQENQKDFLRWTKTGSHYGDSGGASRFFKQVQTEEELESYLDTLVRENS